MIKIIQLLIFVICLLSFKFLQFGVRGHIYPTPRPPLATPLMVELESENFLQSEIARPALHSCLGTSTFHVELANLLVVFYWWLKINNIWKLGYASIIVFCFFFKPSTPCAVKGTPWLHYSIDLSLEKTGADRGEFVSQSISLNCYFRIRITPKQINVFIDYLVILSILTPSELFHSYSHFSARILQFWQISLQVFPIEAFKWDAV